MREITKFTSPLLLTIFCFLTTTSSSFGQVHDTTLYRQNKVKEVNMWVHVVAFTKSNDTCLFTTKKINRHGSPTNVVVNYNCQGWDVVTELDYTYNDKNQMTGLKTMKNDQLMSHLTMKLDDYGRILEEENIFSEPFSILRVKNKYFGDGMFADSMYSAEINNGDTSYLKTTFVYDDDKLLKSNTINTDSNKAVSMLTNKYDEKGRLVRAQFIYFLSYDNDDITKFEYNEKDQIIRTESELSDIAAEFYYDKSGLPIKTFYFNKFGSLEREVWYKYEYYD